jgi:hypothetical protein
VRLLSPRGLQGSRPRSMVASSVLQVHEYWLTDLARRLTMPCATLYKWQRLGWVHSRGIRLTRDTLSHQSLTARACWRCRGRGKSLICDNTASKRSGNPRLKNREAGVVPSEARQSKLCSAVHTG